MKILCQVRVCLRAICIVNACLCAGCMSVQRTTPDASSDRRESAQNFTVQGNLFSGRCYTTHQFLPNVTKTEAVTRASRYLANEGWRVTNINKEEGIISAVQSVIMGQGQECPLNVSVESRLNGVNVVVSFSVAGGLVTSANVVKKGHCALIDAIAETSGESPGTEGIATSQPHQPVSTSPADITARLQTLKGLKESGVLTEEEYQAKRKTLIEKL